MKSLALRAGLAGLAALPLAALAQTTGGVRIGTAGTPEPSAVLDLRPDAASPKGLLPPRLTTAQRDAIARPVAGLVVYQTDNTPGLYVYNGSRWVLQGDNLGNHTATQNLDLAKNQLVGNGGSQGLSIDQRGGLSTNDNLTAGLTIAAGQDLIADADGTQPNNGTLSGGLRLGGGDSGEGLASKRTSGGNQFGLDFYTASTNRLSIDVSGKVGIGTSAPSQTLDVRGAATVSTSLTTPVLLTPTTGPHNMAALAYGNYQVNGAYLTASSGNVGVTRLGAGVYRISVPSVDLSNATIVAAAAPTIGYPVIIGVGGGIVYTNRLGSSNTLVSSDENFSFVVYNP